MQCRRILDAAQQLFAQEGFTRTTPDKIARRAGMSRTLFYHYFQNKEDVLTAVMLETLEQFDQLFVHVQAQDDSISAQIRLLVNGYFDIMAAQPNLAKLLLDQGAFAPAHELSRYEIRVAQLRRDLLQWARSLSGSNYFDPEHFLLVAIGAIFFWFLPTPFGRALGAEGAYEHGTRHQYQETVCTVLIRWVAAEASDNRGQ